MALDGTMIQNATEREVAHNRNRRIGFVFQSFNLLLKLNVLQNVELPMNYSGVSNRERPDRAMDALKLVDMDNRLSQEGRTIALVTHDPEIAAFTPRRIEIRDGKIAVKVDERLAGTGATSRFSLHRSDGVGTPETQ